MQEIESMKTVNARHVDVIKERDATIKRFEQELAGATVCMAGMP